MNRWTIDNLKNTNDYDFAIAILNERRNSLSNIYSPLSEKLHAATITLATARDNVGIEEGSCSVNRYRKTMQAFENIESILRTGDEVYHVYPDGTMVYSGICTGMYYAACWCIQTTSGTFPLSDLGVDVFFTYEEAYSALIKRCVFRFKTCGVTIEQIQDELEYRAHVTTGKDDRYDDVLFSYGSAELKAVVERWNEVSL